MNATMELTVETWVDTARAAIILGHSNRRGISPLVKAGRLEGRFVEKEFRFHKAGMRFASRIKRQCLEIKIESLYEYIATKKNRTCKREVRHLKGENCRCKRCVSEGLTEKASTYVTTEMMEAIRCECRAAKKSQAEIVRQAIVEYLDVRGLLGNDE